MLYLKIITTEGLNLHFILDKVVFGDKMVTLWGCLIIMISFISKPRSALWSKCKKRIICIIFRIPLRKYYVLQSFDEFSPFLNFFFIISNDYDDICFYCDLLNILKICQHVIWYFWPDAPIQEIRLMIILGCWPSKYSMILFNIPLHFLLL